MRQRKAVPGSRRCGGGHPAGSRTPRPATRPARVRAASAGPTMRLDFSGPPAYKRLMFSILKLPKRGPVISKHIVAMSDKVMFMRRCIFHSRFQVQNKQGGVDMTPPPAATAAPRHRARAPHAAAPVAGRGRASLWTDDGICHTRLTDQLPFYAGLSLYVVLMCHAWDKNTYLTLVTLDGPARLAPAPATRPGRAADRRRPAVGRGPGSLLADCDTCLSWGVGARHYWQIMKLVI